MVADQVRLGRDEMQQGMDHGEPGWLADAPAAAGAGGISRASAPSGLTSAISAAPVAAAISIDLIGSSLT